MGSSPKAQGEFARSAIGGDDSRRCQCCPEMVIAGGRKPRSDRLQSGPHSLAAPSLIRMEVAGAFCRATRGNAPRLSKEEADQLCSRWFSRVEQRVLEIVPDETLVKEASGLAVSLGHPLADCLYLELATRWNVPLITAYNVFHDRIVERFPKVRLLKGLDAS
jgi:predicted nucleic acid-binding protein